VRSNRDLHKPAKTLGACEISQSVEVHRFIGFLGRFTEKRFQLWPGLRRRENPFPRFIALLSQQEPREVGNLSLFFQRQSFADADDFLSGGAHAF